MSLDKGTYVDPSKESVGAYLRRWFDSYARTRTSPRTQDGYRHIIDKYLVPALGGARMPDLRADQVQHAYEQLRARGLSAMTVLHVHRVLNQALARAVKWGILARNVCQMVDVERPERPETRALTWDEVAAFLHAALVSLFLPVYELLFQTGMRRSEALGLRWEHVDLERGNLTVAGGLHRIRGRGLVLLPPKTEQSRRRIELDPQGIEMLRQVQVRQLEWRLSAGPNWQETGYVFTTRTGTPVDPARVTRDFAAVLKRAGLPHARLHDIRHTFASHTLPYEDPKAVSARLGHASIQITYDVYGHLLPGTDRGIAERFAERMRAARGQGS